MKRFRKAVSALVLRPSEACGPDGCEKLYEVLLVHKPRRNDAWQLPQGGLEEGETMVEAAIRELKEETNLTVDHAIVESCTEYTYEFPPEFVARHNPVNAGQTLCFAAFLVNQTAKVTVDNDEIDAYIWVLPENIKKYITRKEYLDIIDMVLAETLPKLPR